MAVILGRPISGFLFLQPGGRLSFARYEEIKTEVEARQSTNESVKGFSQGATWELAEGRYEKMQREDEEKRNSVEKMNLRTPLWPKRNTAREVKKKKAFASNFCNLGNYLRKMISGERARASAYSLLMEAALRGSCSTNPLDMEI